MAKRILIVDDDKTTAKQLNKMLETLNYEVAGIAEDGLSAVETALSASVDLILMDIVLPKNIDGIEAAERIQKKKKLPIIFITVYDKEEFFERAKTSNPAAYILKPFNERELELAIALAFYKQDAEKKIQQKEKQLEKILDASNDILFTIAPDGTIISLTKAFERHLGYKIKDWLNKDVKKIISDETVIKAKAIRDKIIKGESVSPFEVPLLSHTGEFIFFETSIEPIISKGKVDLIFGFARNISERKKSEEISRRHSLMFNNISSAVLVTDLEGRIIDLNPAAENLFGYKKSELLFSNISKLKQPDYPEKIPPDILAVIEREGKWIGEFDFIHKNGNTGITISTLLPLKDEEGTVLAHFSLNDDISQIKNIEEALKESYKRFELVSLATQDAIYDWEVINNKSWINQHFRSLFLKENETVSDPDKWWAEHVHPEDLQNISKSVEASFADNSNYWIGEYRLLKNDGEYAYVIDRGYIIRDDNKQAVKVLGAITDITARKENEIKFFEGEKRYKGILDLSPELIFIQSKGKIVFINNSAVKILGGSSYNNFIGREFKDFIDPEFAPQFENFFNENVESEIPKQQIELDFIALDGSKINAEVATINSNWKGESALQIVARDIRSEKLHQHIQTAETEILTMVTQGFPASEVLNKLCKYNEQIFQNSHCTILQVINDNVHVTAAGSASPKLLELVKNISSDTLDNFPETHLHLHEPQFFFNLKEEQFAEKFRETIDAAHIVSCWCAPIPDQQNKIIGLLVLSFTKAAEPNADTKYLLRKSAKIASVVYQQQKLEAEIIKLSFVARQTNNCVMILDTAQKITWVNEAFEKLTGYKSDEVIGSNPFHFLSGHETDLKPRSEKFSLLEKGESVRYSIINYDKRGKKYWVNALIDPMFDANGELLGYFIIEFDITESVEKNNELAAALAKVEESNMLIRSFTANMSHEIRTPLNGILGFAEIIEEESTKMENEIFIRYSQTITRSGRRLLNILNDILDISKMEANKLDVKLFSLDGNLIIAKSISLMQHAVKKKGISLSLQTDTEAFLLADEFRLSQILNNVLSNSIKFTKEGGISIRTSVRKDEIGNEWFAIEIKDSGIGMTAEFTAHAFDAFTQESVGYSRAHEGSGLGLAICKRLCELMNGKIFLQSQKDVGTTVTIMFPAILPDEREAPLEQTSADISSLENELSNHAPKLLVVEDDESSRRLLELNLHKYGMITLARDGADALRSVEILDSSDDKFDVVLMDIGLPKPWSGLELRKEIMKKFPAYSKVPFIAQTALALKSDRENILAQGFDYFVSKPINKSLLVQTILDALNRKKD